jgi:hypothetical protein
MIHGFALILHMMRCKNIKGKEKRKSFTLVEIVFTVSIIGILLAILLPAMSAIKLSAKKVKDVSNLQKIAEAWRECTVNRGWTFGDGNGGDFWVTEIMEKLAGKGKESASDMVLNDPYVWISPGDKYAGKITKNMICYFTGAVIDQIGWCCGTSNFMINNNGFLISYCLVTGLSSNVPLDTTPLAFTRGLREDGKWDEKTGLYGSKGGYVVYCDGHVIWFDGSRPARFLKWDKSGYISDIREAVPNSTWITCGDQWTKTDYKSNEQLVLLAHVGTGGV